MASKITSEEVGEIKGGLTDSFGKAGLSPKGIDSYYANSLSTSFRLPIGGSVWDLDWQNFTFNLDTFSVSGMSWDIATSLLDIRRFVFTVLKAALSLYFLVRVWRLIWG